MRMHEFTTEGVINEWGGARSHPGYNLGIFKRGAYETFAQAIARVGDASIKEFLADWFGDILAMDNTAFKADAFKKAATSTGYTSRSAVPRLQARHFYYLAGEIKKIPDAHAREYCCNLIGGICEDNNPEFKMARWRMFCGIDEMKPEKRERTPRYKQMMNRNEPARLPAPRYDLGDDE